MILWLPAVPLSPCLLQPISTATLPTLCLRSTYSCAVRIHAPNLLHCGHLCGCLPCRCSHAFSPTLNWLGHADDKLQRSEYAEQRARERMAEICDRNGGQSQTIAAGASITRARGGRPLIAGPALAYSHGGADGVGMRCLPEAHGVLKASCPVRVAVISR